MTRLLFVKLLRDLRTTGTRIALMVLALSISLVAFGAVFYARVMIDPQILTGYMSTEPASARIVFDRGLDPGQLASIRSEALAEPGVVDATLRTVNTFQMQTPSGQPSQNPLQLFVAAPDDPMRIARFPVERGSWPPPAGSVLIERDALQFLDLKVGDDVVVTALDGRPVTLRVTGVVHDPSLAPAYEEQKGYGYISTATLPLLGRPATLDELAIMVGARAGQTTPSRDRDAIVRTARSLAVRLERTRGLGVQQIEVPPPYEHPHQGQINALLLAILAFGGLSMLLSAILVATMVNGLITRQVPQIGMLKAIGACSGRILQLYLLMTLLVAAAATVVAFLPAVVLGRMWDQALLRGMLNMDSPSTTFGISWWAYATFVATGLALPLLLALVPLVWASRTTVRDAIDEVGVDRKGVRMTHVDAWLGRLRGLDRTLLMGLRNTVRRRARLLLSVGLLASAGGIFMGGLNTLTGMEAIPTGLAAEQRWDVEVGLARPADVASLTSTVARLPHVTHVEAWSSSPSGIVYPGRITVTGTYPDQGHGSFGITAVPMDSSVLRPPPVPQGRWLRRDDTDAIVLSQDDLASLPGVRVGDTIELPVAGRLSSWRVVGVVKELFAPTCACVTSTGFGLAAGQPGEANELRIVTDSHDPATRMAVAQSARQALTNASANVLFLRPINWLTAVSDGHLYVLIATFLLNAFVMGLVGLIGLGSSMSANVIERTREFGVMHAIGARASAVRRIVVSEGAFTALASCVVAFVLALGITLALDVGTGTLFLNAPISFRLSMTALLSWVVAIMLGAALATLAPAYRASRLTVREALAYL